MSLKYNLEFMKLSKEIVKMDVPRNYKVMCGVLSEKLNLKMEGMLFSALLEFFNNHMELSEFSVHARNELMISVFEEIADRVVNGEDK